MSAIVGFTGSGVAEISDMLQQLRHWQPDREQVYKDEEIHLAVLELFNTPESFLQPQPFSYKHFIIVASCRIDNRVQLAAELGIADINAVADIFYIVTAYEKWGVDCVRHLYGDFAFAIWDKHHKKLFAARDHIGIKTLYYCLHDRQLLFSSEIKGITGHPDFKAELNEAYFVHSFGHEASLIADTPYNNIQLLAPAHFLVWQHGKLSIEKYWEPGEDLPPVADNAEARYHQFKELLFESVRCRLRSVKKIGAEVSGGLDSTAIAGIAMELLGKGAGFYPFCYGKPDIKDKELAFRDDTDIVNEFCNKYGIEDHLTIVNEADYAWNTAKDLLMHVYDEDEPSGVPLLTGAFLPEAQKMNVSVMLSGHGGDQVVSSLADGFYIQSAVNHNYASLWNSLVARHSITKSIVRFVYYSLKGLDNKVIHKSFIQLHAKRMNKQGLSKETVAQYGLYKKALPQMDLMTARNLREKYIANIKGTLMSKRAYHHDLTGKHYNIEYRFPLLDVRLLNYAISISEHVGKTYFAPRELFIEMVKDYIPEKTVALRKSKIPTTPFARAFFKNNNEVINAGISEMNSDLMHYFAKDSIDNLKANVRIKLLSLGNIYNKIQEQKTNTDGH